MTHFEEYYKEKDKRGRKKTARRQHILKDIEERKGQEEEEKDGKRKTFFLRTL